MKTQKERNSEYYQQNKEQEIQRSLEYYHKNKDKIDKVKKSAYMKEYLKNYKRRILTDEEKELMRKNRRDRYQNDDSYREKTKIQVKQARLRNPNTKVNNRLVKEFGITLEQYNDILKKQGGKCAICGTDRIPKGKKMLFVDHCHKTNKVRGILCHNCNMGLGHFMDNVESLKNAIAYLENGLAYMRAIEDKVLMPTLFEIESLAV